MANTNAPFGLLPIQARSGCPFAVDEFTRLAAGASVAPGDPMIESVDGNVVVQAASGVGNFQGVGLTYALTGADKPITVAYQADLLMLVQSNAAGGGIIATEIGLNTNLVPAAIDTTRRMSQFVAGGDLAAVTADLDVKIEKLTRGVDNNEFGAYARVEVYFSGKRHATIAGVGV